LSDSQVGNFEEEEAVEAMESGVDGIIVEDHEEGGI
jgi:hypothetical protein